MTEIRFIDTAADVKPALDWLADLPVLGIDVERDDSHRYHLTPALVQIGGNGKVAIFDPIAMDDPKDWKQIAKFVHRRTTVLHAMENDLPPLAKLGIEPRALHDTSIAAAFLGYPLGLGDLLHDKLGIELAGDKEAMQLSPWERRPLTEEEIAYAAGDVADLPELLKVLTDELREKTRYEWYREELRYQRARPEARARRSYHRIKGLAQLDATERARAVLLWEKREAIASEHDIAPTLLLPDKGIVELAQSPEGGRGALRKAGMTARLLRVFGKPLAEALTECLTVAPVPDTMPMQYPTVSERNVIEHLKAARTKTATTYGIDPGFLMPGKHIAKAVLAYPRNAEELYVALDIRKWQWKILSEVYTKIMFTDFADALKADGGGNRAGDGQRAERGLSDGVSSHAGAGGATGQGAAGRGAGQGAADQGANRGAGQHDDRDTGQHDEHGTGRSGHDGGRSGGAGQDGRSDGAAADHDSRADDAADHADRADRASQAHADQVHPDAANQGRQSDTRSSHGDATARLVSAPISDGVHRRLYAQHVAAAMQRDGQQGHRPRTGPVGSLKHLP